MDWSDAFTIVAFLCGCASVLAAMVLSTIRKDIKDRDTKIVLTILSIVTVVSAALAAGLR